MKAGVYRGEKQIAVEEVADPAMQNSAEAIVEVTYSCVCGSDLWFYRNSNLGGKQDGSRIGHEFMGIVREVGSDVRDIAIGDMVLAPFTSADGTCQECKAGMSSACRNMHGWGSEGYDGGQGQKVRIPTADGTLFKIPEGTDESMMPKLLPLTDVLCTGHHAAVSAGVGPGKTVAVIGDGAVGLCAVAASKRLGAERIILLSTHEDRAEIGMQFGATDIVAARGDDAIKQVKELADDLGVDCALESVGMKETWETAFGIVRKGGNIGFVGVPNGDGIDDVSLKDMFASNIGVKGGIAPAATYIPELMTDVLNGKLDVSAIFTQTFALDDLADAYAAMDQREAIKSLIHPL